MVLKLDDFHLRKDFRSDFYKSKGGSVRDFNYTRVRMTNMPEELHYGFASSFFVTNQSGSSPRR